MESHKRLCRTTDSGYQPMAVTSTWITRWRICLTLATLFLSKQRLCCKSRARGFLEVVQQQMLQHRWVRTRWFLSRTQADTQECSAMSVIGNAAAAMLQIASEWLVNLLFCVSTPDDWISLKLRSVFTVCKLWVYFQVKPVLGYASSQCNSCEIN